MKVSILGYGTYLPRYRILREEIARAWGGRGRGENSVAWGNEDVITMAIEAARNALAHSGVGPDAIDAIYMGTESSPFIEQSAVGVISAALGVRPEMDMVDFGASPRAATAALKGATDAVGTGRVKRALVIGADCRQPPPGGELEQGFGAGACAMVVGEGPGVAQIEASFTYATPFRDTWRSASEPHVRLFEPRYSREYGYTNHVTQAVQGLLADTGTALADYQHLVLYQPDERTPRAVARSLGASAEQTEAGSLFPQVGDAGAALFFLSLAAVLEGAGEGERVLGCSYGSGNSDAFAITVTGKGKGSATTLDTYLKSKEYLDYTSLLKLRGLLKDPSPPAKMGVPPMSPLVTREMSELLRPLGARCQGCGYVNFPPSERHICIRCGGTAFETVLLPRRGHIHTFCINFYLPAGFDESPLPVIIADLEDGTRHRALGTEMKPDDIKIDREVELVVRRMATEDNTNLYGNVFRFPRSAG
jgi:hydroxymethylglutaryl-CoA synthase